MFINQHNDNNGINQTACVIFLGIILIAGKSGVLANQEGSLKKYCKSELDWNFIKPIDGNLKVNS